MCISLRNSSLEISTFSAFNMVNRIEYFSGSTLVCNINPDYLNLSHLLLNPDATITNQAGTTNLQTDTPMVPMLIGEIKTYILKITGAFQGIYPSLIREQLRIRIHWSAEDTFFIPSGCKVSTPPVLLIESTALSSSDCASIMSVYNSNPFRHRFVEPRMVSETKTLAANSKYTVSLSNLNGIYSAFLVWAHPKAMKFASSIMFHTNAFDRVWLTDSNGSILQGGSELTITQRQFMVSSSFPSTFFSTNRGKCVAPIVFSHRIHSDWSSGSCHGVQMLLSQGETLHLTTVSSLLPTEYVINVMGLHMSGYRVQDGRLISMR